METQPVAVQVYKDRKDLPRHPQNIKLFGIDIGGMAKVLHKVMSPQSSPP